MSEARLCPTSRSQQPRNGGSIVKTAEPHFPRPGEKALFAGGRPQKKKKKNRALTSSRPKHCFSLNVNNLRWNCSHSAVRRKCRTVVLAVLGAVLILKALGTDAPLAGELLSGAAAGGGRPSGWVCGWVGVAMLRLWVQGKASVGAGACQERGCVTSRSRC